MRTIIYWQSDITSSFNDEVAAFRNHLTVQQDSVYSLNVSLMNI